MEAREEMVSIVQAEEKQSLTESLNLGCVCGEEFSTWSQIFNMLLRRNLHAWFNTTMFTVLLGFFFSLEQAEVGLA